jgi:excisionase family DNA binding protein
MTFDEVAERIGVSKSTLQRYISAGPIPAFQLGGRSGSLIRIRESDVARVMSRWSTRGGR